MAARVIFLCFLMVTTIGLNSADAALINKLRSYVSIWLNKLPANIDQQLMKEYGQLNKPYYDDGVRSVETSSEREGQSETVTSESWTKDILQSITATYASCSVLVPGSETRQTTQTTVSTSHDKHLVTDSCDHLHSISRNVLSKISLSLSTVTQR